MNDNRIFIDSNIILYLYTDDDKRKEFVASLFNSGYIISTQVVSENINVCLKKLKLSKEEAYAHGGNLLAAFDIMQIYTSTIKSAFDISMKYRLSYWDSLIVATSLESECNELYTEDLHDGLLIEGKLRVKNPFKQTLK
ncbi:MAG: PilT protein domain protein [Flavipsychrobacter sp.]|jgi:predicted nucleic acid-binding protein|nr:PilT protein domain protein [Flavipsychrobacter sp.]